MQYKTIMLELIQSNRPLHQQLCQERKLLTTVEEAALELKSRHQEILEEMALQNPESPAMQVYSQAFELALKEMEERLQPVSQTTEDSSLSLGEAMATIRSLSPRG